VPGYPWYIWLNATAINLKYFGAYHANCLSFDDEYYKKIAKAAADNQIHVSLGASEKDHGSLYISQFLIGPDGETLSARRKLKPTHMERTVFGDGDGSHLMVSETSIGRIGQLSCWEHLQPLSKYAMFSQHEQIHAAAWPSFSCYPDAHALGPEVNNGASRQYAVEGQCFVIAACGVVSQDMMSLMVENELHEALLLPGGGYARIYGPDGRSLAEPIATDAEGLLIAELDLNEITIAKCFADPVGHYSRPDATALLFNSEPQPTTVHRTLPHNEVSDTDGASKAHEEVAVEQ
ncbi:MAG: carbon-nitrogen hydrolase family protein, partial [Pseudomonadota bacterium]